MKEMIRVLLADDHPVVREGIRRLLEMAPDLVLVAEVGDGEEALRLAQELVPDVLILDMEMPRLSGVEVMRRLRDAGSPVRVLAMSIHTDAELILGFLEAGATGYLLKHDAAESLMAAVRAVARGEEGWLSRRAAEKVGNPARRQARRRLADHRTH